MKIATISQTKNHLSALLDRVRHGETILIMDRNRPVARLEPVVSRDKNAGEGRLARLERAGIVRLGSHSGSGEILRKAPGRTRKGGDVLKALLAERDEGR